MGPPLKSFNNISRRQQRRRIRALLQEDINNLTGNNIVNYIHPCPLAHATHKDVQHVSITENTLGNESLTTDRLTDRDSEIEVQPHGTPTPSNTVEIQPRRTHSITDLRAFLAHWAIQNKVPQSVVNSLLKGLRNFGHPELPSDSRTLVNTPSKVHIQALAGGTYAHYGLERALREQLQYRNLLQCIVDEETVILNININIDGLPLSKSSKSQLWPILGKVVGTHQFVEPFVIGAFHGYKKPSSAAQFLQPFLTEYTKLCNEGFMYENRSYFVQLNAVLADTPARNFISCFPAHNSRCAKCIQSGETVDRRRIFLEKDSILRTNDTFREGLPAVYHNIVSPFETIGVDMVKQFPLDYMHLLCLGTMKKLVLIWIRSMGKSVEALTKFAAFNNFYRSLAVTVPIEFSRHPRSVEEVAQWKATEFRLLLLYLGPVVLQFFLSKPQLVHFNALNCAVRIMCDPKQCVRNNKYAQDLMIYFVDNMELLYGKETLIYNIHNLIHISADVLNYGPLDAFSCFPFENFLQKIKLMIKGGAQPLAQMIKRITERSTHLMPTINSIKSGYNLNKKKNRLDQQFPDGHTDPYREIQFRNFLLTDKSPNNCCYLKDKSVVLIEHICHLNGIPVIVGRKFINTRPIADYPCDSRNLDIFEGRELSDSETWLIDLVDRKGFVVSFNADSGYIFPLIHTDT